MQKHRASTAKPKRTAEQIARDRFARQLTRAEFSRWDRLTMRWPETKRLVVAEPANDEPSPTKTTPLRKA